MRDNSLVLGGRRGAAVAAIIAVAAAASVAPGAPSEATPTASAAGSVSAQIAIAGTAKGWKPSSNARVSTLKISGGGGLQLTARRKAGRKTISMRSQASAANVAAAGTTVKARARVRSTQSRRPVLLRVQEVNRGRVVSSRSATVKPSTRHWRQLDVTLRTTRAGSQIRLQTQAKRVTGKARVQVRSLSVAQTVAAPGAGSGAPTSRTPVSNTPCERLDYTDPAQGVRTFTEDFNGTTLDPRRWRVRDNTFLNQDQAWITKDAVSVHDGYLDIAGARLPESQWKVNKNALYGAENATRNYSTGYVDTIDDASNNRFSQRYGSFEVRALVPTQSTMSRGIWPAFWLRADQQVGEIDPMESYGGPTIRSYDPSSSYEWNSWGNTADGSLNIPDKQKTQGTANVGTDKIWQDWHVYGVNWSPSCLRYTYDGKTVGIVDFDAPGTKSYFRGPTFADTFHIRLNLQIGSKYWGWADPEHTRSRFSYKIDWVRVHQGQELLGQ
jgi:beta-glucanase (GH16 family)